MIHSLPRLLLWLVHRDKVCQHRAMILLHDLDLLLRGGALALLLLLLAILIRDQPRALPARLGIGLIITVICTVVAEYEFVQSLGKALAAPLHIGIAAISPLFWLFVRAWFNDETRFGWRSWTGIAFTILLSLANLWLYSPTNGNYWLTDVPMRMLWLGFAVAALWTAWRGRENDLVEARRRIRTGFVWMVGSAVIAVNLLYFGANTMMTQRSNVLATFISFSIILTIGVALFALLSVRRPDMFLAASPLSEPVADDPALDRLATRIVDHIETTLAWRDETLTIAGLAAQLGEQEYRVRRAINGKLGHRNFSSFLNGYRLSEVKTALADQSQADVSILTIALDAGFGSLGPFNRAFREAEAMTPSDYRQARLGTR